MRPSWLAVVVIALSCIVSARNKDVSVRTIDVAKTYVVPVACILEHPVLGGPILSIVGSGFFIDKQGTFVTAGHVLDDFARLNTKEQPCFPGIYVSRRGWSDFAQEADAKWFKFVNCWTDRKADIAVCRPIENPFLDPAVSRHVSRARIRPDRMGDGDYVAFTGFPWSTIRPITSKGSIAAYRDVQAGSGPTMLIIDKAAWPGASGSPVYDRKGGVVGVLVQAGVNVGSGLAYARTSAAIVSLLATGRASLTSQMSAPQGKTQTQVPTSSYH